MEVPVKILAAGLPAEIVREIGLRLRDVVTLGFDDPEQLCTDAAAGDARLTLLSDALPIDAALRIASAAKSASAQMQVIYCLSMQQAENALKALGTADIDRFFLMPLDMDEMLLALGEMCGVDVLPRHASHDEQIAAAVGEAWGRARGTTIEKIDRLDDAVIALLDNALTTEKARVAAQDSESVASIAAQFGFQKGASLARDLAEHFAGAPLAPADGVSLAEQLLSLRTELEADAPARQNPEAVRFAEALAESGRSDDSQIQGKRVLVVDDEPMMSRGLTSLLERRGLAVTSLNDPLRFWSVLDEAKPNLILLDLQMPRINGTELCRAVRKDPRWSALPVVFLTGHTDQASVHRIFASGADDYIGKPFVPAELTMRLESRLTGARVRRPAVETDPLTGLATATKAIELIDRFLRLARRKSDAYAIGVLAVNDFSTVATTFGRTLSDSVLRAIGDLLPKAFRGEDVAGWWGGAEFVVGMYGSTKESAAIKLTQICQAIMELDFLASDGKRIRVACSAGVAEYQVDGDTVAALREAAAKARDEARQAGTSTRVGVAGMKTAGPLVRRVDVVIVLDDASLVSVLQHAMESRNLRVATFGDGETAAAALTGAAPEVQAAVILLGVDLPALNGLEVLRRLKAGQVTRSSSVVMLTARTGESDILAALELGAVDHVARPFSVPVLMHKVRTVLKQSRA
jgi:diguanylate cyclase (GGDEF)-like protein